MKTKEIFLVTGRGPTAAFSSLDRACDELIKRNPETINPAALRAYLKKRFAGRFAAEWHTCSISHRIIRDE